MFGKGRIERKGRTFTASATVARVKLKINQQTQAFTKISRIGPGMTVVGEISSEGALNVLGRVKGELHASVVLISNGGERGRHHHRAGTNDRRSF